MPTEFFQLAEAIPSVTTQIQNERTTTNRKSGTIDYWRDVMQFGGWTEDTVRSPRARVTVQLNINSLPIQTVPPLDPLLDGGVICEGDPAILVTAPGSTEPLKVWGFDPGRYAPPPCEAFAYGDSKEETAALFKAKLEEALQMGIIDIAVSGSVETITLEDAAPGTHMNGVRVGGWVSGTIWHGGWKLDSEVYRGHFISISGGEGPGMDGGLNPNHKAWELFARVHSEGDPIGSGALPFSLFLDSTYQDKFPWRICVCPYQMGIWVDGRSDGEAGMPYPQSVLISMPWVPSGFTGHEVFAFVSTGLLGNLRLKLEWNGQAWFDDEGPWIENAMIVPVLRTRLVTQPGIPDRITTSQGMLILDNAFVTARREPDGGIIHNRLVGKLWNCCTVADNYPPATIVGTMLNADWIHVSSQSWYADYTTAPFFQGVQKASVWWRFDNSAAKQLKEAV